MMQPTPYGYARPEVTYMTGQGVQVTSSRFIVYGQMYPVNAITSVASFTEAPSRTIAYVGALVLLVGLVSLAGSAAAGLLFLLIGGACIAVGVMRKPIYVVVIGTSGMQVRALRSPNAQFVQYVVTALHQAVAAR